MSRKAASRNVLLRQNVSTRQKPSCKDKLILLEGAQMPDVALGASHRTRTGLIRGVRDQTSLKVVYC
jgi:hypothetical protein